MSDIFMCDSCGINLNVKLLYPINIFVSGPEEKIRFFCGACIHRLALEIKHVKVLVENDKNDV